jgi:hypothetical protein
LLSCGIPSPSHHGFFSDCAAAAIGRSAGAKAAVAIPLIRFLREKSDFILKCSLEWLTIHAVVVARFQKAGMKLWKSSKTKMMGLQA